VVNNVSLDRHGLHVDLREHRPQAYTRKAVVGINRRQMYAVVPL